MGGQMAAMRLLVLALLMAIIHSLENVVPLTKITRSAADHLELVQVLSRVHAHLLLDLDGPAPILLHNHQNTQYVGAVKVGTPGQALMSIFDTGSGTFWVPSKDCKAAGCNERPPFDNRASSTFAEDPDGDEFSIKYGSGSVDGKVVIDDMLIGGIKLPEARIGVVTTEVGSAFENAAFSGLVGMAYPTLARAGMHPVFDQMIDKKLMKNNRFTFFMSNDADKGKSGIWFDDVPQSLYQGKLKKHPVISKNYWSVKLLDIKVDGKSTGVCPNGCKAAIDSGTSLLTAPTTMARTVLNAVSKGKQTSATQLLDVGVRAGCQPIKEAPTLTYVLESEDANGNKTPVDYDLAPEDYMLEEGVGCGRAAVSSLDVPQPNGPVVILGDIFMSKYLSVFDRDADAVYIGKANQDSDKSMMFTDQPSDALLELDDVETDNWTEISAVSY